MTPLHEIAEAVHRLQVALQSVGITETPDLEVSRDTFYRLQAMEADIALRTGPPHQHLEVLGMKIKMRPDHGPERIASRLPGR